MFKDEDIVTVYGDYDISVKTVNDKEVLIINQEEDKPTYSEATGISWFGFWIMVATTNVAMILTAGN